MLRERYYGKSSSLSLFKSDSRNMRNLITMSKLPSLSPASEVQRSLSQYCSKGKKLQRMNSSQSELPVCDEDISVKIDYGKGTHQISNIPEVPNFPSVESKHFLDIFKKKIASCSIMCSFYNDVSENISIDNKTKSLNDFHNLFLGVSPIISSLKDEDLQLLYEMCIKNINRRIVPLNTLALFNHDVAMFSDPSWVHLSLIYQIITRLFIEMPYSKFFNHQTIDIMFSVIGSNDVRERSFVIQFLIRFMEQIPSEINYVISRINKTIFEHSDMNYCPYGVHSVLTLFLEICKNSVGSENLLIASFRHNILPLIGDKYFSYFDNILLAIIEYFIEDDNRYSYIVVNMMLKKWPYTKLSKQVVFFNTMSRYLPKMGAKDLSNIIDRVLFIYANALDSECSRVAEAAFSMWTTHGFEKIIADNMKTILPLFIPHIMNALRFHWCQIVRENASFALSSITKHDSRLAERLTKQCTTHGSDLFAENLQMKGWVSIARASSLHYSDINLSSVLLEISSNFSPNNRLTGIEIKPVARPRSNSLGLPSIRNPIK